MKKFDHQIGVGGLTLSDYEKQLVNHLEHLNVETRDLLPLINQPIYKRLYGNLEGKYPVARHINESGFYIGCHSYMSDDEVGFVMDAFRNFFKNNRNRKYLE